MTELEFRSNMNRARLLGGDYGAGYQRGLRRLYHGESFGTPEEHSRWLALGLDGDPREEIGRGYRDGFAGKEPKRGAGGEDFAFRLTEEEQKGLSGQFDRKE